MQPKAAGRLSYNRKRSVSTWSIISWSWSNRGSFLIPPVVRKIGMELFLPSLMFLVFAIGAKVFREGPGYFFFAF